MLRTGCWSDMLEVQHIAQAPSYQPSAYQLARPVAATKRLGLKGWHLIRVSAKMKATPRNVTVTTCVGMSPDKQRTIAVVK
jgi:hypothetical protein